MRLWRCSMLRGTRARRLPSWGMQRQRRAAGRECCSSGCRTEPVSGSSGSRSLSPPRWPRKRQASGGGGPGGGVG